MQASPLRAFLFILDSPKWPQNLLWLSLAALTQNMVIGTIFLFGYGAEMMRARVGIKGVVAPDIESGRLGDYFNQGIVPILAYLVFALPSSCVISVLVVVPAIALASFAESAQGDALPISLVLFVLVGVLIWCVLVVVMTMFLAVVLIRGMITQDFRRSFDIGWMLSFLKLMFVEMLLGMLVLVALSMVVVMLGMAILCVGVVPASGICSAAMLHLCCQWYEIFLSRGGEPVEGPLDDVVTADLIGR